MNDLMRLQLLGGRVPRRTAASLMATVVTVVGLVWGNSRSIPDVRSHMHSGAVWLNSREMGYVTLVDGPSARVAANVAVARPWDKLRIAQQGPHGLATNLDNGTLTRVDGATLQT